ncbi:MAG: LysR family transcriptional regulator, partial [Lachnospiraceae bacterium]|nr:LysR family transcriptional regulator [Lachnospiraceae bacterium]
LDRNKNIKVRDRATLFNLVIGLNGYTVSSGVISRELNGENIIAKPLQVDEYMRVGIITQKNMPLSRYGQAYVEALKRHIGTNDDE